MPKISIIIPCYNVEEYLDRCLKSVINQTLQDIEIILVDDGSPDRVPQMCDGYAKSDSRIKVVHKQNAGLGYARNSGLEIATGDYVAFVDSDDYMDLSMYSVLYDEAVASNADVVFCGFKTETQPGIWMDSNEVKERTEWDGNGVEEFMLDMIASAPYMKEERKYQMSVWHSIYRRSIIGDNNIRFHSEREIVSEDLPFQVDFLLRAAKVVYLPQTFYFYCLNGMSLTAIFKPEKYDGFKALYMLLNQKMKGIENYHLRTDRFFIGYVRSFLLHLFSSQYNDKKALTNRICKDEIWDIISKQYKASYLSAYPKVIYKVTLLHNTTMLAICCHFVNYVKKHKGLRRG